MICLILEAYYWFMVYGCYVSYLRYILALGLMHILVMLAYVLRDDLGDLGIWSM
jgi:hypothetical protein